MAKRRLDITDLTSTPAKRLEYPKNIPGFPPNTSITHKFSIGLRSVVTIVNHYLTDDDFNKKSEYEKLLILKNLEINKKMLDEEYKIYQVFTLDTVILSNTSDTLDTIDAQLKKWSVMIYGSEEKSELHKHFTEELNAINQGGFLLKKHFEHNAFNPPMFNHYLARSTEFENQYKHDLLNPLFSDVNLRAQIKNYYKLSEVLKNFSTTIQQLDGDQPSTTAQQSTSEHADNEDTDQLTTTQESNPLPNTEDAHPTSAEQLRGAHNHEVNDQSTTTPPQLISSHTNQKDSDQPTAQQLNIPHNYIGQSTITAPYDTELAQAIPSITVKTEPPQIITSASSPLLVELDNDDEIEFLYEIHDSQNYIDNYLAMMNKGIATENTLPLITPLEADTLPTVTLGRCLNAVAGIDLSE